MNEMTQERIITILLLVNMITLITSGPMQMWTYELVEIFTNSSDRNLFDLDLKIQRLGRGKYGFSGFFDIKTDLYDDILIGAKIERSLHRAGPYTRLPMALDNYTISYAMNMFYRTLLQPTALKCCENAPVVKGTFKAPITKRYVIVNKCSLSTNNLPNILMEGYYKFSLSFYGPLQVYGESICYVESLI